MFIEGSFSWDKEGERTSLEWPPLMSPDVVEEPPGGQRQDEVALDSDPDITASDSYAGPGLAPDPGHAMPEEFWQECSRERWQEGPEEEGHGRGQDRERVRGHEGSQEGSHEGSHEGWHERWTVGDVLPVDAVAREVDGEAAWNDRYETVDQLDGSYADEEEAERPPRRRLSRSKGPIIVLGTAVIVALSGGYAAQAFGWRLPPRLRESAEPMRTFLWNLAPSRLVGLMGTEDSAARGPIPAFHDQTLVKAEVPRPLEPGAEATVSSTSRPSGTDLTMGAAPSSQDVDPGDRQASLDRDAPAPETVAAPTAPGAGEVAPVEQAYTVSPSARRTPAAGLALPLGSSSMAGLDAATRTAPPLANRDHMARAWHGFVWSPAEQRLVPAVTAIEGSQSIGTAEAPVSAR